MNANPILDELYAAREKLLAEAGGDMHRYVQQALARALASGRPLAEVKQRTIRSTQAVKSSIPATEIQSAAPASKLSH